MAAADDYHDYPDHSSWFTVSAVTHEEMDEVMDRVGPDDKWDFRFITSLTPWEYDETLDAYLVACGFDAPRAHTVGHVIRTQGAPNFSIFLLTWTFEATKHEKGARLGAPDQVQLYLVGRKATIQNP